LQTKVLKTPLLKAGSGKTVSSSNADKATETKHFPIQRGSSAKTHEQYDPKPQSHTLEYGMAQDVKVRFSPRIHFKLPDKKSLKTLTFTLWQQKSELYNLKPF